MWRWPGHQERPRDRSLSVAHSNRNPRAAKILLLLNAGSAVTVLAYQGHASGNGPGFPDMRVPMGCYIAGLVLGVFAFATMYLTQLFRFNEILKG
jgi:hypothetical protein